MEAHRLDPNSLTPKTELLELLKEKCPEVFTEGKVDEDKLRQSLGDEIETGRERYGLSWAGKSDCFRHIQEPTTATLVPVKEESVDFDKTQNIFIEGDNLQVLKIMQKSYYGKIKMIYIDPPYNTGNDSFIYPDRFQESKEEYLQRIGDKDEEGNLISDGFFRKNSKDSGHFHSNWLSMMYPRLFLARNLIQQDGVIFISIDDNEIENLRMIMDEIFGENNFINLISVKVRESAGESGGGEDKRLKKHLEYLLMYAKNRSFYNPPKIYTGALLKTLLAIKASTKDKFVYGNVMLSKTGRKHVKTITGGSGNEIKIYTYKNFEKMTIGQLSKKEQISEYDIYTKFFDNIYTTYNARTSIRGKVSEALPDFNGLIEIEYVPKSGKYKNQLTKKFFSGKTKRLVAWMKEVASMSDGEIVVNSEVGTLWTDISWATLANEGDVKFNDGKKPINFVKRMLQLAQVGYDETALDFFAGSGTTGHAVMTLNCEDGLNRKFICVQLPELCNKESKDYDDKYETIADICKDRLKIAGDKIAEKNEGKLDFEEKNKDLGFKVLKLSESNFKVWRSNVKAPRELEKQMGLFVDNVRSEAKQENILYELILKSGLDINVPVETKRTNGKQYFSVGEGKLVICLEDKITQKLVDTILKAKPEKIICLDKAFSGNDQLKTNTALQMESEKIDFKVI